MESVASRVESLVKGVIHCIGKGCPYLWESEEYVLGWTSMLRSLRRRVNAGKGYERRASRAEEFDILVVKGLWSALLRVGAALRLLSRCNVIQCDMGVGEAIKELTDIFEELYNELRQYPIEHVPLEKQVIMQLYTVMLAVKHLT